eukprot:scaffold2687_cov133-Chaetoceros_neogracile.AAC.4
MAVKRGMLSSAESTPMDVEREVYRQFYDGQKTGKDTATRISGRSIADQKVKKRNRVQRKQEVQQKRGKLAQDDNDMEVLIRNSEESLRELQALRVESEQVGADDTLDLMKRDREAIGAAKEALSHAEYNPPKGMNISGVDQNPNQMKQPEEPVKN